MVLCAMGENTKKINQCKPEISISLDLLDNYNPMVKYLNKPHRKGSNTGAGSYNRGIGKYPGILRKIPGYFSVPRFYDVTPPGY